MRDERIYLEHILECLGRIQEEVDRGEQAYRGSKTIQESILMNLLVVGETIKSLSASTRRLAPGAPWGQIARLRDMIAHRYRRIDRQEIWDIVRLDVPPFRAQVEQLIQQMSLPMPDEDPEADGPSSTEG